MNTTVSAVVGMERMRVEGTYQDFVKIAFAGTDFLYVPGDQFGFDFQIHRCGFGRGGKRPRAAQQTGRC